MSLKPQPVFTHLAGFAVQVFCVQSTEHTSGSQSLVMDDDIAQFPLLALQGVVQYACCFREGESPGVNRSSDWYGHSPMKGSLFFFFF